MNHKCATDGCERFCGLKKHCRHCLVVMFRGVQPRKTASDRDAKVAAMISAIPGSWERDKVAEAA